MMSSAVATVNNSNFECPPAPRLRARGLPEVSQYSYDPSDVEVKVPLDGFWAKLYAILFYVYSYCSFQNVCGFKRERKVIDFAVGPTPCPFDFSSDLVMVIVTEVDDHWRLDLLPPVTADHFCAAFFYVTRLLFFVFFGLIMMAPHERRRKINIIPSDHIGFFMTFHHRDDLVVGPKALEKVRDAGIQVGQL